MALPATTADEWYAIGDAALREGRIPEASEAFGCAIAVHPSHANALYRLAEIARATGDPARARELLQRTLAVHPQHAGAKKLIARLPAAGPSLSGPGTPPRPPSGAGIVGVVASVKRWAEPFNLRQGSQTVLSIRVQTQLGGGSPGQTVAAEMRGYHIRGGIEAGDWVELPAGWKPGTELTTIRNLTTGSEVVVSRRLLARTVTASVVTFVAVWIAVLFTIVGRGLFF